MDQDLFKNENQNWHIYFYDFPIFIKPNIHLKLYILL